MKKPVNLAVLAILLFAFGLLIWLITMEEDMYEAILWRDSFWCLSAALSGYAYAISKKENKTH
ncbi:hypothetical protein Asulf_02209 [Archaeoglobus sulfaticallidus PM70-1]|uniref:Uncharacterized protein n=1 Tax=Archaeoglobus sulfaticallidus PM70-1 TaxID=387631 RepID=N0BIL6_9EURY|nr:hypothetical protein Asulf_02209 [Archaeoglobus sulfaticallidus PM70-1]